MSDDGNIQDFPKTNDPIDNLRSQAKSDLDKRNRESLKSKLVKIESTIRTHQVAITQLEQQAELLIADAKKGIYSD